MDLAMHGSKRAPSGTWRRRPAMRKHQGGTTVHAGRKNPRIALLRWGIAPRRATAGTNAMRWDGNSGFVVVAYLARSYGPA